MELFLWDARYLTGEAQVDEEHRGLVELINRVVALQETRDHQAQQNQILDELVQYAVKHFEHEEQLMAAEGCDERHVRAHQGVHGHFAQQVGQMRRGGAAKVELEYLLRFLSSWLAYHILGIDQSMARQVRHIRAGMSPAQAYEADRSVLADPATSSLLTAMHALYGVVTQRNQQLLDFNEQLEELVGARTQDLASANQSLLMRNHELQRLNARLEDVRQQLLQAEKLAAVGQLAAGVAHEINNPISFVQSNIRTLDEYFKEFLQALDQSAGTSAQLKLDELRSDIPLLVRESQQGIERVRKIVQDLRDFAQVDSDRSWGLASLEGCMDSTLNLLTAQLGQGPAGKIRLVREDTPLPEVWCCASQINHVFAALLLNAAEALPTGRGEIRIRNGLSGQEQWYEISDNGFGIEAENLAKIFDPFFTTKPIGAGTGMGLAQAWGIMRQHKGRIEVSSQPGEGACFRVSLPMTQA